eukprot:1275307-Rhodomonas_salina.1
MEANGHPVTHAGESVLQGSNVHDPASTNSPFTISASLQLPTFQQISDVSDGGLVMDDVKLREGLDRLRRAKQYAPVVATSALSPRRDIMQVDATMPKRPAPSPPREGAIPRAVFAPPVYGTPRADRGHDEISH